jgi:hypothetical protein
LPKQKGIAGPRLHEMGRDERHPFCRRSPEIIAARVRLATEMDRRDLAIGDGASQLRQTGMLRGS